VKGRRAVFAVILSLLAHAGVALALRRGPPLKSAEPEVRRLEVRMIELPPEPPPPAPEPASVQPEPPKPEPEPPKPKPAEPPPPPSAEVEAPPKAEPEPPPDVPAPLALLDASIQAAASGVAASTALDAPGGISRGGARPAAPALPLVAAPAAPAFTPLGDLSRKPRPPSLDALLRRNYPESLRRRGIDGQAMVRAHVTPRGRVARVEVLSESAPGFADACRRTLLGSEWTEPLDRNGNRVATQLTYRCRFEIER
jgi:periplasmic protein TonB